MQRRIRNVTGFVLCLTLGSLVLTGCTKETIREVPVEKTVEVSTGVSQEDYDTVVAELNELIIACSELADEFEILKNQDRESLQDTDLKLSLVGYNFEAMHCWNHIAFNWAIVELKNIFII